MTTRARDRRKLSTDPEFAVYPQLIFYYGFSVDELITMPRHWVRHFADALPGLIAAEQVRAIEAASFVHLKHQSDRSKLLAHYRKQLATIESIAPPPGTDAESATQTLMGIGIGVEFVEPDEDEVSGA